MLPKLEDLEALRSSASDTYKSALEYFCCSGFMEADSLSFLKMISDFVHGVVVALSKKNNGF